MANHAGSEGVVKIGADTIAEVRSWSVQETAATIDDTTMGDAARTFKTGLTGWNGSLDAYWDETDTNGQGALTAGASVTLNLYPEGTDSTDTYYTGTALITGITRRASLDGMVEASFTFQGSGALTSTAVA